MIWVVCFVTIFLWWVLLLGFDLFSIVILSQPREFVDLRVDQFSSPQGSKVESSQPLSHHVKSILLLLFPILRNNNPLHPFPPPRPLNTSPRNPHPRKTSRHPMSPLRPKGMSHSSLDRRPLDLQQTMRRKYQSRQNAARSWY